MESEAPSSTPADAPSDEHDWLFDYVMSAFQSPSWEVPLLMFIDFNWCAQAACPFFELHCACVRICGRLPPSHPHLLFAASYLIVMKRTSLRTRTCIGCAAHCSLATLAALFWHRNSAQPRAQGNLFITQHTFSCSACCYNCNLPRIASRTACVWRASWSDALYIEQRVRFPWRCACCTWCS